MKTQDTPWVGRGWGAGGPHLTWKEALGRVKRSLRRCAVERQDRVGGWPPGMGCAPEQQLSIPDMQSAPSCDLVPFSLLPCLQLKQRRQVWPSRSRAIN